MTSWQKIGACAALLLASACVHTNVSRTGRMPLGHGNEGYVPVFDSVSHNFEEVAVIAVRAQAVSTEQRRSRHLSRRASLLGCDGIIRVAHSADETTGVCVRRRGPLFEVAELQKTVVPATADLRQRAANSGAEGVALLKVLDQADNRPKGEKAWPLQWYLSTYPQSPFRADVEALFVVPQQPVAAPPASIRAAPTVK